MRPFYSLTATVLLAGLATAQGQLPLPSYSSTYSSSAGTRGLYFQAPVDFEVSGLRVPDEQKTGTQNVTVYVMKSVAAGGSQTATPVFTSYGSKSANIIRTSIKVLKGEYLVVLGCAGDASSQKNSYGAGGYNSNVLGKPITMTRVYTNTNMITQKGAGSFYTYATTSTSSIGRVEIFVKNQSPLPPAADATTFGAKSANKGTPLPYLPIDDFSRTYSSSSQIRGFWFKSPTKFLVTGFRVPNEAKVGQQVVAFYTFASDPGTSQVPTASDLKFFTATPAKADQLIQLKTPIAVNKDEWVAVLGAAYDTTPSTPTYENSYSATSMDMQVLGQSFTAQRLTAGNVISTQGLGSLGFASSGNCARVEIHVAGQTGFPKVVAPDLSTTAQPITGTTAKLDMVANIDKTSVGVVFGSSMQLPGPVKTPFGSLLISPAVWGSFVVPTGTGELSLPIPQAKNLFGIKLVFQGLTIAPSTSTYGMTNGVEWTIGGRAK